MGQLSAGQLAGLRPNGFAVTAAQLDAARRAWAAFAAPDPRGLAGLLRQDALGALPYTAEAMRLHLQRFPAVRDGLGLPERLTLEALEPGPAAPAELFRRVTEAEPGYGLGDLSYGAYLERMSGGPAPLLSWDRPVAPLRFGSPPPAAFREAKLALTPQARRVLAGVADAAETLARGHWLGGVLQPASGPLWRWDADAEAPVLRP
ncbi:hypothetical protein N6H14_03120 [Paenibacillus sp. CC-CFT747]|nr:hypothetical protein N6H14_03120 [Paenibacillus sp. CC-CFT747]